MRVFKPIAKAYRKQGKNFHPDNNSQGVFAGAGAGAGEGAADGAAVPVSAAGEARLVATGAATAEVSARAGRVFFSIRIVKTDNSRA